MFHQMNGTKDVVLAKVVGEVRLILGVNKYIELDIVYFIHEFIRNFYFFIKVV